jgi:hypothetical protein
LGRYSFNAERGKVTAECGFAAYGTPIDAERLQSPTASRRSLSSDPRSDARKPVDKVRLLGQIATPIAIADEMAESLLHDISGNRILDPCVGPHTFLESLLRKMKEPNSFQLTAIDIDDVMVNQTKEWAKRHGSLHIEIASSDYLVTLFEQLYDGIILNPPYIRQEWIERKNQYQALFSARYGAQIPGTSNLYVYFLVKAINDLRPGGVFSCIIYDSWRSTRFGHWLNEYMLKECESLSIRSVPGTPFEGRLIDATIINGKRRREPCNACLQRDDVHKNPFSSVEGFVPLEELFFTKRGLRLKQSKFFLIDSREQPIADATPFIKKVHRVQGYCVPENHSEAALLVSDPADTPESFKEIQERIAQAMKEPEKNMSVLTWYRERPDSWFSHREAPYAPLIFNYYLRKRPRHIFNPRFSFSDNFYGLTPRFEGSTPMYVALLNSTATCASIIEGSRNQGNGLSKIQLFEYRKIPVPDPRQLTEETRGYLDGLGRRLIGDVGDKRETLNEIDELLHSAFGNPLLRPSRLSRGNEAIRQNKRD